ncbi:MAG: PAS domain S-box protein, partial [Bryobacteraceae bacterium]
MKKATSNEGKNPGPSPSGGGIGPVTPDLGRAFEATSVAMLIVQANDPIFTVVAANSSFLQLGGISRDRLLGHSLFEVFPNDPRDSASVGSQSVISSYRRVIASAKADIMPPYRYDLERTADGERLFERRYWSAHNTPLLDETGRVEYILQSLEEVTVALLAKERAEEALLKLKTSEERFRQIAETSGFGLIIANRQGGLSYVNDSLLLLLGYTGEEVASGLVRWDKLTPPEQAARDEEAWAEVLATGKCAPYEKVYIAKDGRHIPILIGASLIESASGETEVAAFVMDLTARKHSERDSVLVRLDDAIRPIRQPEEITHTAARVLAEHLNVNRCAYADVEEDEDTFNLTGDYNRGVNSIVGRYRFRQFGEECLRLMRAGEPYVVEDAETDVRVAEELASYRMTQIRSVICVPLRKGGRFVAGMAVHQIEPRRWKPEEVELVRLVADRCWESIERARVTRELRESEYRYRFLAQSIPQMVWTATPAGALDYVSDQATRYFGAAAGEVLGAGWLQWVHPEDQEFAASRWKHSLATGEPYETSFRLLRASDDSWRWHLVRAEPLREDAGEVTKWFGTCTDIEDQKRAESSLAEQARLSALGADIGVALTRDSSLAESLQQCTQAIVTHLDAAFARIWTLSSKKDVLELQASAGLYTHLDGSHARVPVGEFKIGRIALNRRPHLTNAVPSDPEVNDREWARREGMVSFAGYPLVVKDRLIGVLGLFARHSLGPDTLNALGAVAATIAIAIEQKRSGESLVMQAAELKRSNEDLEQFAHVASHDLRSPLNTIRQFTELIVRKQGTSPDGEMDQLLQIVRNSAVRMGDLITALLTYSRLNDADIAAVRPVSSLAIYEDALENLGAAIAETHARIECENLPEVLCNPAQLLQVFQNLISNALHYRGAAPPLIRVTASLQNSFWLFSVADNGPGIAPQYHSLI